MLKKLSTKVMKSSLSFCQRLGASKVCPTEKQFRGALFVAGISILALGLSHEVLAASASGAGGIQTTYNDVRIANAVNVIITYLEGSFGALIMATAGIMAIMSAAFGQYKAALSLMVVAVGSFILRSFISTFFNDENILE
jgi:hypothetical protein